MAAPVHVLLSQLSGLFPFGTGLFAYKNLRKDTKILLLFFSIALITELIAKYLAHFYLNNLWLYHVHVLIEYCILIFIFSYWQSSYPLRLILRLSIFLFILIWFLTLLFKIETLYQYNSLSRSIESLILTCVSLYTLRSLYLDSKVVLYENYIFWFSAGVLVYFSGNFMFFTFGEVVINGTDIGIIHSVLNILSNLLYAGGFLCLRSRLIYGF